MKIRSEQLEPASPKQQQSVHQRKATSPFVDQRPEAVQQRQIIQMMQQSSRVVKQRQQMQGQIPQGEVVQGYFVSDHRISGEFTSQVARDKRGGGKTFLDAHDSSKANLETRKKSFLRIATSGNLAIEDSAKAERQAKVYYSTTALYQSAQKKLKAMNSPLRLIKNNKTIHVTNESGKQKQLYQILPVLIKTDKTTEVGTNVRLPENCNDVACKVTGAVSQTNFRLKYRNNTNIQAPNATIFDEAILRLAKFLPSYRDVSQYNQMGFGGKLRSWFKYADAQAPTKIESARRDLDDRIDQHGEEIAENYSTGFFNQPGAEEIEKELGINAHIKPNAGDVLMINRIGDLRNDPMNPRNRLMRDYRTGVDAQNPPAPYHFAIVLVNSGSDYITIENYARQNEEQDRHDSAALDPRYFFRMYGPGSQSFHAENEARYPNALTVRLEK